MKLVKVNLMRRLKHLCALISQNRLVCDDFNWGSEPFSFLLILLFSLLHFVVFELSLEQLNLGGQKKLTLRLHLC